MWEPGQRPEGECIEWDGKYRSKGGYGLIYKRGRPHPQGAHRIAVEAPPGSVVLHLCDNKSCINPDHLRIGTQAENNLDRLIKERRHAEIMRWALAVHFEVFGALPERLAPGEHNRLVKPTAL